MLWPRQNNDFTRYVSQFQYLLHLVNLGQRILICTLRKCKDRESFKIIMQPSRKKLMKEEIIEKLELEMQVACPSGYSVIGEGMNLWNAEYFYFDWQQNGQQNWPSFDVKLYFRSIFEQHRNDIKRSKYVLEFMEESLDNK